MINDIPVYIIIFWATNIGCVNSACPVNSVSTSDGCYWLVTNDNPEHIILASCESNGGTLATIPDQTIMNLIITEYNLLDITRDLPVSLYIGVNDKVAEGIYKNYEGHDQTWFNWETSKPEGAAEKDCVILQRLSFGTWTDNRCDEPLGGICFFRYPKATTFLDVLESTYHTTASISETTTNKMTLETSTIPVTKTDITEQTTKTEQATYTDSLADTPYTTSGTAVEQCVCVCYTNNLPINQTTLQEKIRSLIVELTISKKDTSRNRRKLTSAQDNRMSAKSIGYVGVLVLVTVVGLIVGIDALNFCQKSNKK